MSYYQIGDIRVELGDPIPFGEVNRRELIVTAALGAPFGTTDPVDLALLSAASRKEDLRHYEQLAFTPLAPENRYSVARVRKLADKREEVIARGELETILALCHPNEAVRYRAELQADLELQHGFGALAIARGGAEAAQWTLVGVMPVRATREKSRRSDEPEGFRYVCVWDWQLRVIHWAAVFLILLLSATGILMGESRFIYDGTGEHSAYFSYLRLIHFSAGWFLVACAILRVAGLFLASNRFQRWDALFPVKPRDLKNLFQVAQNYLFCRFERGPHYIGHNPLQQVAYTAIYAVGVAAIVTGFALYALYAPESWPFHYLVWFDNLVGVQRIRLVHLLIMYIFLAFIPIHVYLSIRADTVEREGAISSIVSGGRWCRKGARFEDG
jgi:Ni/Fe-hydrogenase 1 B-type cytochrome subunit